MSPAEGVKLTMLQMTPCMLHMETRIGLKVLTLILKDSLSNAKGGLLSSASSVRSEIKGKTYLRVALMNCLTLKKCGDSKIRKQCLRRAESI